MKMQKLYTPFGSDLMTGYYRQPVYVRKYYGIQKKKGFFGIGASELEIKIEETLLT